MTPHFNLLVVMTAFTHSFPCQKARKARPFQCPYSFPPKLFISVGALSLTASNRYFGMLTVVFSQFCHRGLPTHFLVQAYHLLLVVIRNRFFNRMYGIEQITVALFTFLRDDGGRLGCDQPLLDQTVHIFFDGVVAHTNRFADCFITWLALKCFPIFTIHEVGVDQDFTTAESQREDFIRQRKIIFHCISLGSGCISTVTS